MPARVSFLMSDIKPRRLGLLHNGHLTVIRFWHGNLMSDICHAMARSSGRGAASGDYPSPAVEQILNRN